LIKEPFLKMGSSSGDRFIRVDSPSDVLVDDYKYAGNFKNQLNQLQEIEEVTWEKLKVRGNELYKNKEFELALRYYKLALNFNETQILYLNCSACSLEMKRFSQAFDYATTALSKLSKDRVNEIEKAKYRIGSSLYGMRQWESAKTSLEELLSINKGNMEARKLLDKANQRLVEKRNGAFDFSKIFEGFLKNENIRFDVSDYVHKSLRIEETNEKGKHVIATSLIPKNTLIVVSKAFGFSPQSKYIKKQVISINFITKLIDPASGYECLQNLIENAFSNHFLADEVNSLYSGGLFNRSQLPPKNIIEVSRLEAVSSLNSFSIDDRFFLYDSSPENTIDLSRSPGEGLFIYPSYFNHSCLSNTIIEFIGDLMVIHVKRDIKSGEELTISYTDYSKDFNTRESHLNKYNFICQCELCQIDRSDKFSSERILISNDFQERAVNILRSGDLKSLEIYVSKLELTYYSRNKFKFSLIGPLMSLASVAPYYKEKIKEGISHGIKLLEIIRNCDSYLEAIVGLMVADLTINLAGRQDFTADVYLKMAMSCDTFQNKDLFKMRFYRVLERKEKFITKIIGIKSSTWLKEGLKSIKE